MPAPPWLAAVNRTALVTGGAGFIGSHVAEALVAAGWRVLVLDDLSSGSRENVPAEASFHQLDIRSADAAELLLDESVDLLVHHAAQMDVRRSTVDPCHDADVNILGTLNLLEAAVRGSVRQVIFASTGGAIYGEQQVFPATEEHPTRPLSPYGVSKLAGEHYLSCFHASHGLDVTCLRYANVYGERQRADGEAGVVAIFLGRLLAGESCVINGDGLQTRDYVHVSDVVQANRAAIGLTGFHVFNVGTGVETTVTELHRFLADAVGWSGHARHGPAKPGEQRRSAIDCRLIQERLGTPPPLSLAEGLPPTVSWFGRSEEPPSSQTTSHE